MSKINKVIRLEKNSVVIHFMFIHLTHNQIDHHKNKTQNSVRVEIIYFHCQHKIQKGNIGTH